MHNFKKILLSAVSAVLVFAAVSSVVLHFSFSTEMCTYQDSKLRESLAGQLNFLTVGASNSLCAFESAVIDEELGVSSYNLSGALMTLDSRYYFTEKELERNPVETVVIDLSYETLTRDEHGEYAQGDAISLARMASGRERVQYLVEHVDFDDWLNLYANAFTPGIECILTAIKGDTGRKVDYAAKGFYPHESNNIELSGEDAKNRYEEVPMDVAFREENIAKLKELIALCHDHEAKVILAVVPISDSKLWRNSGHDIFYQWAKGFSEEEGCALYDFNLLKSRYTLFNDRESFFDTVHIGRESAAVFTREFCDILRRSETEDVSDDFYPSYEAMKADSPYMAYLQ